MNKELKCRVIIAMDEQKEKKIYTACDIVGIDDDNITIENIGGGMSLIYVYCGHIMWEHLKHELKLFKVWM